MLNTNDITLICPKNDLEGSKIIDIAIEHKIDTRISLQDWGGKLSKEPEENLKQLKKKVIVVELFDVEAEEKLIREGHEVIIIDHHNYSGAKRWRPESAIEQFCHLIGHQISDEVLKVAVNDTKFIPGLFEIGLSYEEMEKIRIEERNVRGTSELFQEALLYATEHRKPFKDLDLILVPIRFHRVMGEAAQWPSSEKYDKSRNDGYIKLPNCLLIYHDDQDKNKIIRIEYYGDAYYFEAFNATNDDPEINVLFDMWSGGSPSGCYWGATPKGNIQIEVDKLIDKVLSFTLIQGRPLRHFSTTFLFPFSFKDNNQKYSIKESNNEEYSSQEKLYFLPQVQQFLFQDSKDAMNKRSMPLDEQSRYLKVYKKGYEKPITLNINAINLYNFFNNIHMLEISVLQRTEAETWGKTALWRQLTSLDAQYGTSEFCSLEDALIFNNLARILYPTYTDQDAEAKIPEKVVWKPGIEFRPKYLQNNSLKEIFSPVVLAMIQEFIEGDKKVEIDFDAIWDDRMFVHTCLALAGDKPANKLGEARYHAVFSTATYIDTFGSGWQSQNTYCYDAEFTQKLIEPLTYKRWYGPSGNLYGFSRFSAIFMGFGYFFHKNISDYVDTTYLLMSILALFYRASLLRYSYNISKLAYPSSDKEDKKIKTCLEYVRNTHWELTNFSNKYWFREVTSQDQGIEIFNLQNKAMDLQIEYDGAKQKIDHIYGLLDSKFKSKLTTVAWWVGSAGLIFTLVSIVAGYAGFYTFQKVILEDQLNYPLFWATTVLSAFGSAIAFGLLFFIIIKFYLLPRIYKK